MIKFSSVVDQADDREVRPLERNQVDSAYAVHKARVGDNPRPEEDVVRSSHREQAPSRTRTLQVLLCVSSARKFSMSSEAVSMNRGYHEE